MRELRDKIKIFGEKGSKEVDALFDTGAPYGYVSRDIAEEIGLLIAKEEHEATLPDGHKMKMNPALGEVEIKGCKRPLMTYVAKGSVSEMVLGMLQMESMGIKIDAQNGYTVSCELPRA